MHCLEKFMKMQNLCVSFPAAKWNGFLLYSSCSLPIKFPPGAECVVSAKS